MPVYEIIPFTDMTLNDSNGNDTSNLEIYKRTSLHTCKRFCGDTPDCVAFTWNPDSKGTCALKNEIGDTGYKEGNQLYIKKGNSNYTLLWIMLTILLIGFFVFVCRQ